MVVTHVGNIKLIESKQLAYELGIALINFRYEKLIRKHKY